MKYLDQKINEHFPGMVVRKDLVKQVKGNAIVPTYVLEYLLGQYCATSDENSIQSGIDTVKEILRKHYVHRGEANLVKSYIREKGRHKVIDKITVELNEKQDCYQATFANLGISEVLVDTDTIKHHPKLLVSGVWCLADMAYQYSEDPRFVPWILESIKPIQQSQFDFEDYKERRTSFSLEEWIDLLVQSIGFDPAHFDLRAKLLLLVRLIPYCERNYNLIELGPKGTGKSHIYSDFSPHGILISGGEVTVPKLFVNNRTGRIGLVGFWDAVAFDEFAGRKKKAGKELVDILKNYMANKSFSRGVDTIGAEASLVFVGNTAHDLSYMLRYSDLFEELPSQYYDSAFLDRLHFYLPGWEVEILRGEMFSDGYGFVVDYLAEILRGLRSYDYSQKYTQYFELSNDMSTRDKDGTSKTFSGLVKILYPDGNVPPEMAAFLLEFAMEGRKRVKDQLMRIDTTYAEAHFAYQNLENDNLVEVKTLEEKAFPQFYYLKPKLDARQRELESKEGAMDAPPTMPEELAMIRAGEGNQIEFKSTLRWNLMADKADQAIEKQVLKTVAAFLNTEGGTLLVGVSDQGEILGIEPDQFENADKYQLHFANLVNERIGRNYVDLINGYLVAVEGKEIFRVDCKPSSTPVFDKGKDGEEFFIRNGPSTNALQPSQVVDYTRRHF